MNVSNTPHGRLFNLQIGSPAPERLAGFYAQIFGMRVRKSAAGWICSGAGRCLVFSEDEPNRLLSAGYVAPEAPVLQKLELRTASSRVDTTAIDSELFEPGALALRDPDGNRIVYGRPLAAVQETDGPAARLQHVVVASTDIERMVTFYTAVVGLRKSDEVREKNGEMRACFLRSDEEHHSFAVFQAPSNRLDHHCYELPDWNGIRDWGDRLAAHGVPVKWGPGRHGPGNNLFLFFHDPDGNWVELLTELEVVSPERPVGIWPHEERTLNSWGRGYLRS